VCAAEQARLFPEGPACRGATTHWGILDSFGMALTSGKYAKLEDEPCEEACEEECYSVLSVSDDHPRAEASHVLHGASDAGSPLGNESHGEDAVLEVCSEEDSVTFRIECAYRDDADVCTLARLMLIAPVES
jgi:hypothetical protein